MAEPPAEYLCPISMRTMVDPVVTADGQTYERTFIEEWLRTHSKAPRLLGKSRSRSTHWQSRGRRGYRDQPDPPL